jgi:MinD-like ATPase involved in chromosome partitioning or flagellar assembly
MPRQAAGPPPRPLHAEIVVVGAHGGAGVSTLAALLRPAWDMGVVRGPRPGRPLRPGGRPVVLVARNTVAAAGGAVAATKVITRQGTQVAVLVVVSDGLPEPAEARYRFRVLQGRVGAVVRMPFVPALRAAGSPLQVNLPRKALRALAEIRVLAQEQARGSAPVTRR